MNFWGKVWNTLHMTIVVQKSGLMNRCLLEGRYWIVTSDTFRSSHPEVFLEKGILKICSKFTAEHPCRCVISIKLLCNFIEITLRHRYSPVNLLHIFITPFTKNTSGRLFLYVLTMKTRLALLITKLFWILM